MVCWHAVLVLPVVSGVGVLPSAVFGSVVVVVAPVVVEGVDAVGGWWCRCVAAVGGAGDVVGEGAASGAPGVGAAGDADGEGVVGDALMDGGVLTVARGLGPRHSWRRFPWALLASVLTLAVFAVPAGPPLASLMPMVLQALYRVVSPWGLSLALQVAVTEVALSVVLLVMPVARPLRALPWFTASLMLLILLVVGVGPCVGGQWLVFGGGLPLFPGGRWLVPLAPTGRVCSTWCGPLVMPLVRVLQAMPRVMSWVRVVLAAPVVWVPLVTVWWMASCAMLWWRGCCC